MIMDTNNLFTGTPTAASQAITSTAASTNVLDTGAANYKDVFLEILAVATAAFTTSDAAVLTVALQHDSAVGFGTVATLWSVGTLATTALTLGTVLDLPPIPKYHKRYLRLYFTVGTGTFTAGSLEAAVVFQKQTNNATVNALTA